MIFCTHMVDFCRPGHIPYKQKYWRTLCLAVCSKNAVGGILNWRISVLYGETHACSINGLIMA